MLAYFCALDFCCGQGLKTIGPCVQLHGLLFGAAACAVVEGALYEMSARSLMIPPQMWQCIAAMLFPLRCWVVGLTIKLT